MGLFDRWRKKREEKIMVRDLDLAERVRPKGHTVPRAEIERRRKRNKMARLSRRKNR